MSREGPAQHLRRHEAPAAIVVRAVGDVATDRVDAFNQDLLTTQHADRTVPRIFRDHAPTLVGQE
ncbi:MAG: hypothetical protein NVS4B3_25910 [Gemmatimonadaceae bacterium]